jgi:hypothetical protein
MSATSPSELTTQKKFTGEITPSYALLSPSVLSKLREQLEQAGFRVKVLFFMRNPVDRVLAAFAMEKQRGTISVSSDLNSDLIQFASRQDVINRTRYELTLENIGCIFKLNQIYVGFYEEMFSSKDIKRFSNFLEMSLDEDFHKKIILSSNYDFEVDKSTLFTVKTMFNETYNYIERIYPQSKKLWRI